MRGRPFSAAALVLAISSSFGQVSSKPKYTGTWQIAPEKCELKVWKPSALTFSIDHPDKAEIHIVEVSKAADGQQKKREFRCSTMGRECEIGDNAKLSIYYNGPKLVAIERIGKDSDTVYRRTYSLAEDGSSLTVEIAQIVPPRAEVDKIVLVKLADTESSPAAAATAPEK